MQSLAINDVKLEIGPTLAKGYNELGVDARFLNPTRKYEHLCPHSNMNCFEAARNSYHSGSDEKRKDTATYIRGYADIIAPKPDPNGSQNPFFGNNGYRCCQIFIGHLVVENAMSATPNALYNLTTDPNEAKAIVRKWAAPLPFGRRNGFCKSLHQKAKGLLAIIEAEPKYWGDFLFHVSSSLEPFDDAGHLADYGDFAVAEFADLRKKPSVLVIMTPLDKINDYSVYTALNNYAVFAAAKAHPDGVPIHLCLDEFTVAKWPNFEKEMITMRGLGITAEIYVQDKGLVEELYGEKQANAIYNQCDIKQAAAIDNLTDAEHYSKMMGSEVERSLDPSVHGHEFDDADYRIKDEEAPLKTPASLMAMPPLSQIIKIRGMYPIEAFLVPYWMIFGLRKWFGVNPQIGKPAPKGPYVAEVKLDKDGLEIISKRLPDDLSQFDEPVEPEPPIFQLSSFLWAYLWAAILFLPDFGIDISWPAMRYEYQYSPRWSR